MLRYGPGLAAKREKLVRTGRFQSSCRNAIPLHLCLPVARSDTYPADMYRHTTTPPWKPEDELKMCREWSKARHRNHPAFFFFSGVQVCLCVYLGSLSCPCWDPWPRPSSYIREAWKRALGHLEQPISSQSTGYGEALREDGD